MKYRIMYPRGAQDWGEAAAAACPHPALSYDFEAGKAIRKIKKVRPWHPASPAVAQASHDRGREIASRHRLHKPTHWYRPQALAAFHGLVQGIAVGNIDERTAAVECRQGD